MLDGAAGERLRLRQRFVAEFERGPDGDVHEWPDEVCEVSSSRVEPRTFELGQQRLLDDRQRGPGEFER